MGWDITYYALLILGTLVLFASVVGLGVALIRLLIKVKNAKLTVYLLVGSIICFVLSLSTCCISNIVIPTTVKTGTIVECENCGSEVSSTVKDVTVSRLNEDKYKITKEKGLCDRCSKSLRESAVSEFEKGNWEQVEKDLNLIAKYEELADEEKAILSESGLRKRFENGLTYLESGKEKMDREDYSGAVTEFDKANTEFKKIENKNPALSKELNVAKYKSETASSAEKARKLKIKKERDEAIEKMRSYEMDAGDIGIAVSEVKLRKTVSYWYSKGNSRFVLVAIGAKNFGSSTEHVNPNDFTLSTPSGYTVSHDTSTYSLGNYFDAVNLPPGGITLGWIVFYTSKQDYYFLNYESWGNRAKKKIYVTD